MTLNNSNTKNIINPSNSTSSTTTSTKGNGNTQACAACKYQRRKCTPDCVLAPYFPHDRQRQFLNAHKLFGVSNITKIIKNLDQPDKDRAMHTIIFQSDLRANDPVGGCYRIIREYQRQIEYYKAELDIVLHQLAICRAQAHHHQPLQISESAGDVEPALNCEMMNVVDPLSLYTPMAMAAMQQPHYHCLQPQQDSYVSVVQNDHSNLQEDVSTWVIHDSEFSLHTKQGLSGDHDHDCHEDIKPLHEVPCERNETKFETAQDIVERRFAPSPQLLTSS